MNSLYVMHYTISSLYTVKKDYLSIKCTMFHFTRISLYTIYLEKPKSCKVRATCIMFFFVFNRGVTECTQPVEVVSYKIGVCKVSPSGKECRTEFERLNYNGRSSVVLCRPFTGRMHQIRVHLQYLGK